MTVHVVAGTERTPAEALDIADLLDRQGYAAETVRGYSASFTAFARWAERMGAVPLPADPATVRAYVVACVQGTARVPVPRAHGSRRWTGPMAISTIEAALAAIRAVHVATGFADPVEGEDMVRLRRKVRMRLGPQQQVRRAAAVRARDMVELVGPRLVLPPDLRAALVVAELMWRHAWSAADVEALAIGDVVVGRGRVRLQQPGRVSDLICRRHEACPHCAAVALSRHRQPGEPLLRPWVRRGVAHRERQLREALGRRGLTPGADGTISGGWDPLPVLVAIRMKEARVVWRGRALLLTAWHKGMRPSDWRRLRVGHVARHRDRDGWLTVLLTRSKNDHGNGVRYSFRPARDPRLCPVAALEAWLPVVHLLAASGGTNPAEAYLFGPIEAKGKLSRPLTRGGAKHFMFQWQRRLGLPIRFSGMSLRVGFVVTALEQGASLDQVRFMLRHRKIQTTRGYAAGQEVRMRIATLVLAGHTVAGIPGLRPTSASPAGAAS